jgi:hypothetical protein
MNKPVSVDFQFSIKQRGRGAKKRIVEGAAQFDESKPALERIPRISRYMALAIHFEDLIRQGVVTDYADLARLGHVTRARVTQIMNLRLLAPEIQEQLLDNSEPSRGIQETVQLKTAQLITGQFSWIQQRELWHDLILSHSLNSKVSRIRT